MQLEVTPNARPTPQKRPPNGMPNARPTPRRHPPNTVQRKGGTHPPIPPSPAEGGGRPLGWRAAAPDGAKPRREMES
jgi:hypothetical protein